MEEGASKTAATTVAGATGQERVSKEVSTLRGEPKNNDSVFALVEEHPCFRNATLVVIVVNAVWIAVDVEWNHSRLRTDGRLPLEPVSTVVEHMFCVYFSAELVIRFLAFHRKILCFWDGWFVFDSTLVALMVFETWVLPLIDAIVGNGGSGGALSQLSSFRLLRLLRLTRMAKIMRFFPELVTLIRSIVDATQAVFFILLFLVIVVYVFAIVFTSQLAAPAPAAAAGGEPSAREMFGDIGSSMMTLFTNGVLGDNLAQTLTAIKDDSLLLMWLFVLFMLISGVTLLNMLIGVLCQVIDESSKEEEEAQQLAELRASLSEAFRSVDVSDDGEICEAEWGRIKESSALRASLARLGVDESDMDERMNKMQESVFKPAGGAAPHPLGFEEFIEKILELRWDTPARALDVEMLKATITLEDNALKRRLDRIESNLMLMFPDAAPAGALLAGGGEGGEGGGGSGGGEGGAGGAAAGGAPACDEARARGWEGPAGEAPGGWLTEVPTELLFHMLKARE